MFEKYILKPGDLISWHYSDRAEPIFIGIIISRHEDHFLPMLKVHWLNKKPYETSDLVVSFNAKKLD